MSCHFPVRWGRQYVCGGRDCSLFYPWHSAQDLPHHRCSANVCWMNGGAIKPGPKVRSCLPTKVFSQIREGWMNGSPSGPHPRVRTGSRDWDTALMSNWEKRGKDLGNQGWPCKRRRWKERKLTWSVLAWDVKRSCLSIKDKIPAVIRGHFLYRNWGWICKGGGEKNLNPIHLALSFERALCAWVPVTKIQKCGALRFFLAFVILNFMWVAV